MTITPRARQRLENLLRQSTSGSKPGFRIRDLVGSCRGSAPLLEPASEPAGDEVRLEDNGIVFFVAPADAERLREAVLDYDPGFLGKGLAFTWPHCPGCTCSQ